MKFLSTKQLICITGGHGNNNSDNNIFTCLFSWFKKCP